MGKKCWTRLSVCILHLQQPFMKVNASLSRIMHLWLNTCLRMHSFLTTDIIITFLMLPWHLSANYMFVLFCSPSAQKPETALILVALLFDMLFCFLLSFFIYFITKWPNVIHDTNNDILFEIFVIFLYYFHLQSLRFLLVSALWLHQFGTWIEPVLFVLTKRLWILNLS